MSLFLRILFYGAIAGTVTSTIYCGMVVVGALRFARRKRREEQATVADFLPPVSVLKPLHGTEPAQSPRQPDGVPERVRRGAERAERSVDSLAEERLDEDRRAAGREAEEPHEAPGRLESLWQGTLIVLQSMLAVAFGAGLFVAFDELWRWNSIVALVLSVLVILGLVVGVRVVRKTEDIASTLIAVAVGALITLGPLALSLQSG